MKKLRIENKKHEHVLDTLDKWKEGFVEVDRETHWRDGYSAQSLAIFFTTGEGQLWLDNLVKDLFTNEIEYATAEIEHESKLDTYSGKHRMQDLAIWGTINGKSIFIAIEAKVLEPFGNYSVRDEYEHAIWYKTEKNENSKKTNRIEDVVSALFPKCTPYDEKVCNLRYQLLHYLTASIREGSTFLESKKSIKKRCHPEIVVLPVLVFKTKQHLTDLEKKKAELNEEDYRVFCNALGFEEKSMNNRKYYFKTINNCSVYTLYEEVEIRNEPKTI